MRRLRRPVVLRAAAAGALVALCSCGLGDLVGGLSAFCVAPAPTPEAPAAASAAGFLRAADSRGSSPLARAKDPAQWGTATGGLWGALPCCCCGVLTAAVAAISAARGRRLERRAAGAPEKKAAPPAAAAVGDSVPAGTSLSLFSPAKVNLFLRIIRRREDGYHDLASLFHTVSFGDTLDLEVLPTKAESDELECNLPDVPTDDSNLVIRALNLFREKTGATRRFRVKLEKRIPAQAGLGGGSSNAATAFFGANQICGSPASPEELIQWADDPVIGSDATFFLSQGTAYCTGRGEILTPMEPLPDVPAELPIYLVKPRYGLSTRAIFKALDLAGLSESDPEELLGAFKAEGLAQKKAWVNDLEAPAFQVCPELGKLRAFLAQPEHGFQSVLMSGSGSTVYCVGEPSTAAAEEDLIRDFLLGIEAEAAPRPPPWAAVRKSFDIEGIWRAELMRRRSPEQWYEAPKEAPLEVGA